MAVRKKHKSEIPKLAIMVVAFFNVDLVRKTLLSLVNQSRIHGKPQPYDIYVIENQSPKSDEMQQVLSHYRPYIKKYILSDTNNAVSSILDVFQKGLISRSYDFYAITEGDIILDDGAIDDCLRMMQKYQLNVGSIGLKLDNLPIQVSVQTGWDWILPGNDGGDCEYQRTGYQFTMMRRDFFFEYIHFAKGCKTGMIETLSVYAAETGTKWYRTKNKKLLHTGWDLYTPDENEYSRYKKKLSAFQWSSNQKEQPELQNSSLWDYKPGAKLTLLLTEKYFKIHLSASHKRSPLTCHGLMNQLISLVNGIIIGDSTERQLVVNEFYPNYNSSESRPLEDIVDIDRLNTLLSQMGLKTRLVSIEKHHPWKNSLHKNWIESGDHQKLLNELAAQDHPTLDLGNTFAFIFHKSPDQQIRKLFNQLLMGIPFNEKFYEAANIAKSQLELSQYHCVHLRLEDDSIEFRRIVDHNDSYMTTLRQKYLQMIEDLFEPDQQIFLATDLGKNSHQNSDILDELRQKFSKIATTENQSDLPVGGECYAIVDYLICRDGVSFIGVSDSTFSTVLFNHYAALGKPFYDCLEQ